MKSPSVFFAILCLAVIPYAAEAKPRPKVVDGEPPRLGKVPINAISQPPYDGMAEWAAVKPEIPLGPPDVLKEYEREMALVTQRMSTEIAAVSQAQEADQITREQADYLIEERYQVAMMQHQVLSALHESLERDVAHAGKRAKDLRESGTTVVVGLPASESSTGCK